MRAIPKKGDIHAMFTFLTRLGRLVIGIPIVVAVTSVAGFGALSFVPAASTLPANSLTLASSDPSFGATIAFSATYAPMKWIPEESVSCSVNGKEVYLDVQTFSGASPWTSTCGSSGARPGPTTAEALPAAAPLSSTTRGRGTPKPASCIWRPPVSRLPSGGERPTEEARP